MSPPNLVLSDEEIERGFALGRKHYGDGGAPFRPIASAQAADAKPQIQTVLTPADLAPPPSVPMATSADVERLDQKLADLKLAWDAKTISPREYARQTRNFESAKEAARAQLNEKRRVQEEHARAERDEAAEKRRVADAKAAADAAAPFLERIATITSNRKHWRTEEVLAVAIKVGVLQQKLAQYDREWVTETDADVAEIKELRAFCGQPLQPDDVPSGPDNIPPGRIFMAMVTEAFTATSATSLALKLKDVPRDRLDAFTRTLAAAGGPDLRYRFANAEESERYFTARRETDRTAQDAQRVRGMAANVQALQPADPRRKIIADRILMANTQEARAADWLRLIVRELEASNVDVPALAAGYVVDAKEPISVVGRVNKAIGRIVAGFTDNDEPPNAA